MARLSETQLSHLRGLETELHGCVKLADVGRAEEVFREIGRVFAKDLNNHRLLKAANWYAECALESNQIAKAQPVLVSVSRRAGKSTRIFLEATGLLAITYLRGRKIEEAKQCISYVISRINKIQSTSRRHQFQKRLIERIDEECLLVGLSDTYTEPLNSQAIHDAAVELLQKKSEDEILALIGREVPSAAVLLIKDVKDYAILQLPASDKKFLMLPELSSSPPKLGKKCFDLLKRISWKAFCHPNSEIYQLWSTKVPKVYGSTYFASAIGIAFKDWKIGLPMLASGVVAIALKYGVEEFCTMFKPNSLMITPTEKDTPK